MVHPECLDPDISWEVYSDACPTDAIRTTDTELTLDLSRCIVCGLCADVPGGAFTMEPDFELATRDRNDLVTVVRRSDGASSADKEIDETAVREALAERVRAFGRSFHVRHVDAGSCGACESEIRALQNPFYNLHRLGIFFTPAPRHADLLLVTGPVTRAMEQPLREAYDALPEPKVVIAACGPACGGGIYTPSYATLGGVDRVFPVDVYVPGSPPPPLSILYGILLALGRVEQKLQRVEAVAGADA